MADARSGIGAAVRELAEGAEPLDQEAAETADLFGDDETGPDWGSPLRGSAVFPGGSPAQKRGPGRPKGARSLVTKEVIDKILKRYPHPLIGMAEVAATPVHELALSLLPVDQEGKVRGKPTEEQLRWAYEFWFKVTAEFTEYVATKQPRQLMADGSLPPMFTVYMGAAPAPGDASASVPMGMTINAIKSTEYRADAVEVPRGEVPQPVQPAADATASGPSGS